MSSQRPISYPVHNLGEVKGNIIHDLSLPTAHMLELSTKGNCNLLLLNIPKDFGIHFYIQSKGSHHITLPNGLAIIGKGKEYTLITQVKIDRDGNLITQLLLK